VARNSLGQRRATFHGSAQVAAFLVLVVACFVLGGPAHKSAVIGQCVAMPIATGGRLSLLYFLGLARPSFTPSTEWDGVI